MKRLTLHRLASALLCLTLALSLTACGGKKKPAPAAGNSGVKETISDSRTDQTGQADPEAFRTGSGGGPGAGGGMSRQAGL